jgi:hypothetical protein
LPPQAVPVREGRQEVVEWTSSDVGPADQLEECRVRSEESPLAIEKTRWDRRRAPDLVDQHGEGDVVQRGFEHRAEFGESLEVRCSPDRGWEVAPQDPGWLAILPAER